MAYIYYGSMAILMWKCGSQLLKEAIYVESAEEKPQEKGYGNTVSVTYE